MATLTDKKNNKILIPEYIEKFKCIGAACEDSCCNGWTVNIDRNTYKKYRNTSNNEFKKLFKDNISRYRKDSSDGKYAKIAMDEELTCPFLNEASLCKIHKDLGEDYLSITCSNYPKETNYIDGIYEMSCTLSCPEAARLAILNPKGISFLEIDNDEFRKYSVKSSLATGNNPNSLAYYFWDIRMFALQLMKTREYSIEERLLILGLLLYDVQEKIQSTQIREISQVLTNYQSMVEKQIFKDVLQEFNSDLTTKIEFIKRISDYKLYVTPNTIRYKECLAEIYTGLSYTSEIEKTIEIYSQGYKHRYEPFMKEHSYILENYIVNYIFKNMFPLKDKSVVDSYIVLVIHFAIVKTDLIGLLNYHKDKINEDCVIKLIQSFGKALEHNNYFFTLVQSILDKSNYKSMGHMATLIKDN